MTREEAIQALKDLRDIRLQGVEWTDALNMAIEALSLANLKEEFESADAVSREEYDDVKAYMEKLVDAFI